MAASTKSGSGDSNALPPVLEWAQRKDRVWITVVLENCPSPAHELKGNVFHFKGKGGTENLEHAVTLELYGEIDPEKSTTVTNNRHTMFTLMKTEESAGFWPRLTKDKKKLHFLKTDFNKWQDESDSEDMNEDDMDPGMMNPGMMNPGMMNPGMMNPGMMNPGMMNPGMMNAGGFNLDEMMKNMGGMKGGDFDPGAPTGEEHDSDDEELPDLQ